MSTDDFDSVAPSSSLPSSSSSSSSSSGPPAPAPISYGSELLKYLAVGRLTRDPESGDLQPEKHRLVAHNFGQKSDVDPEWGKEIKSHLKLIMKKAGHKLLPGKRIRLKDDKGLYEVHILTEEAEQDPNKTLVFFAVTDINFPKYHSVPALLRDIRGGFFQTIDAGTLWSGGSVQRACQPYFQKLMTHYATSPLMTVQIKVENVKNTMHQSVVKAMHSVELLEEMDEKAEMFEDQSKKFSKRSEEVKVAERSKFRMISFILCFIIFGIVLYFIISAIASQKNNSSGGSGGGGGGGGGGGAISSSTGSMNITALSSTGAGR